MQLLYLLSFILMEGKACLCTWLFLLQDFFPRNVGFLYSDGNQSLFLSYCTLI